ncbi:SPFH domain-containing protein [Roseomonas sp. BN140053]|uniref:SPFH domain-containing protein n=1 Tax=Roseomonas sp. BN140053 TaxID=3391898 RepID=UPI0039E7A55F
MSSDDTPAPQASDTERKISPRRSRVAIALVGLVVAALAWMAVERAVVVRPGTAQMVVVSRGGEVTGIFGPGQVGFINPWTHTRTAYDTALLASDRSAASRAMPGLSAEGHPLTLLGVAFWHEGNEADLRWRFAHIRSQTEVMQALMASSVQAVLGRYAMDDIIHRNAELQAALTEELKNRARALLRVEVVSFAVTGLEPGDSYRQVVAERELGKARAASVAGSPALTSTNPNALELERIRRWDGRGTMPNLAGNNDTPGNVAPPRSEQRAAAAP